MRLTKLQLVRRVLNAIDSDEVTSVSDTVESEQVGMLVDAAYDWLLSEFPWPHLRDLRTLEVTTTANQMRIPTDVVTVNSIRYSGEDVTYLKPMDMHKLLVDRDTTLSNVDSNGAINDHDPTYWSSYDDEYVVFDSYNGNLVSANTVVDSYKVASPMTADGDYPDLPERFHPILADQATADSFYNLKGDQIGFNIYRRRAKDGLVNMQRWAKKVNRQTSTGDSVNYGRQNVS